MSTPAAPFVSASSASLTAAAERSSRSLRSLSICWLRTAVLSTLSTSIGSSASGRYLLTPITGCLPESMRAWVRAAASSMRILGSPWSMALAMPPARSTSWMWPQAARASSRVSRST